MRRDYVNIGTAGAPQRIHYRTSGSGPPLLMLHASPMSSAAMVPLMNALAGEVTAIAPDTPGYGQSDPLASPATDLLPYVDALDRFRAALGIDKAGLYGTATGAQIAVEYAKICSEHVDYVILDNAADFSDEDRATIVNGYFPDLSVEDSGAHLLRLWAVARDLMLFFPWHKRVPGYRLPAGAINPQISHAMAVCYLEAGPDYDRAYRAAFKNEQKERLLPIRAPTTIIRWEGSILKPYTDRFDTMVWPDHFRMEYCGPTPQDRIAGLQKAVHKAVHKARASTSTDAASLASQADDGLCFVDTPSGQQHLADQGQCHQDAVPLLVLHDIGQSNRVMQRLARAVSPSRRVLVPDLLGHGHSAAADSGKDFVEQASKALTELLQALSISHCDVLATGHSAILGARIARTTGLSKLFLLNPVDGAAYANQVNLDLGIPDLNPRADGAHLISAWAALYQQQLFHPWYRAESEHALPGVPDIDGASLNGRLLDLLWAANTLKQAMRSVCARALGSELGGGGHVRWMLIDDDPRAEVARQTVPGQQWLKLPPQPESWSEHLIS